MGDVINMRQWRKAHERAEKERQAAANRAAFGRPKASRKAGETVKRAETARHEGHRLAEQRLPEPRPAGDEPKA